MTFIVDKLRCLFARDFDGMTEEPVTLKQLTDAREDFISEIVGRMPDAHRAFLISFERGNADWKVLNIPHAADLPAIKWRQINLDKLSAEKRGQLVAGLEKVLSK